VALVFMRVSSRQDGVSEVAAYFGVVVWEAR
jgi:hypothetical protein